MELSGLKKKGFAAECSFTLVEVKIVATGAEEVQCPKSVFVSYLFVAANVIADGRTKGLIFSY